MELLPKAELELINRHLAENYGHTDDKPHFRLAWSEDQFEKYFEYRTPEGLFLTTPRIKERRKYNYIQNRYILEKLTIVPEHSQRELMVKLSYEAIWTFQKDTPEGRNVYVRPIYGACKFIVETVLENLRVGEYYTKYKDPDSIPEEAKAQEIERINLLKEELFGNESNITDALSVGEGVAYGKGSSPHSSTPLLNERDRGE